MVMGAHLLALSKMVMNAKTEVMIALTSVMKSVEMATECLLTSTVTMETTTMETVAQVVALLKMASFAQAVTLPLMMSAMKNVEMD